MLMIPYHLTSERYNGAVSAIFISPIFGYILLYMFTSSLAKFPGKGLPEIFNLFYPKWVVNIVMIYKALLIGTAGAIVISTYALIVTRFLNPDANQYFILALLLAVCGYGATRSTTSVTFLVELILVLNIPIVIFVMYKTIQNPLMNWDAVHIILDHYNKMPTLLSLACATFIYTGFLNFGLFNRLVPPNFRFKYLWLYPLIAFIVLLITFFVPIGIHGTETVGKYIFLWSATSDSTRMLYGFIERMLFVFLFVVINIALTFTIVSWHMMIEYIRSALPNNVVDIEEKKPPLRSIIIITCIVVSTMILMASTNSVTALKLSGYYLIFRMLSETLTTIWVFILGMKKVKKNAKKIKNTA